MMACNSSLAMALAPQCQPPRNRVLQKLSSGSSTFHRSSFFSGATRITVSTPAVLHYSTDKHQLHTHAEYREGGRGGGSGNFVAGFLFGGVVCGALAFVFAPQLSKTLLGENEDGSPRKLPKWLGEDDSLEATRRKMNEKLAELNRAIDRTSAEILGEEFNESTEGDRVPDSRAIESIDAI